MFRGDDEDAVRLAALLLQSVQAGQQVFMPGFVNDNSTDVRHTVIMRFSGCFGKVKERMLSQSRYFFAFSTL